METPSSIKRVTRSQTLALNTNNNIPLSRKIEDSSDKGVTKSRRMNAKQQQLQDRVKNIILNTPGSGEALLRGQVKTLLQKVEEEAELSKLSLENRPFLHLQGFVNSPMGLLAPTPANTPQVPDISGDDIVLALPVIEEKLKICQEVSEIFDVKKQDSLESQKSLTRSLLLDFSEKSESIDSSECSSALTYQGDNCEVITNAEDEEAADAGGLLDELCEGISKISVKEKVMAKFEGKHTRFAYNSDDEIVEEVADCEDEDSDDDFRLKGLPTPKGKHIRFHTEEE
ncbi:hypothetical protein OIU78_020593 [Salix suchowensis]|nr:hypothetical protein OIU78_020593 [Salix suchowensis]